MQLKYTNNTVVAQIGKQEIALDTTTPSDTYSLMLAPTADRNTQTTRFLSWPGEYEIANVLVEGVPYTTTPNTTLFRTVADNISLICLTSLDTTTTDNFTTAMQNLSGVDIIIITLPTDSDTTLVDKWKKTLETADPSYIIYLETETSLPANIFTKTFGQTTPEKETNIKITKTDTTKEDMTIRILANT